MTKGGDAAERPRAMRSVNAEIAAAAADFERGFHESLRWVFTCECGEPGCAEWIELDLADYEAIRDGTRAVLAEGHNAPARRQAEGARRGHVRRDYRYELRDGERTVAVGRLTSAGPIEVADTLHFAGKLATVERIEQATGDDELLLVAQIHERSG